MHQLVTLGIASGLGANHPGCRFAPILIKRRTTQADPMDPRAIELQWEDILRPRPSLKGPAALADLVRRCARHIVPIVARGARFIVIGGDHSTAMGVWQSVLQGLHPNQRFGLLWIDAHLDLHNFASSPSGLVHGMPLAALLGVADPPLRRIYGDGPHLEAERLLLFGARSWEPEEQALLQRLGLRSLDMAEIVRRGSVEQAFKEGLTWLRSRCDSFGVSIDLDAIDPLDAPGVGTPVPAGLSGTALCTALRGLAEDPRFLGVEIAEFNPLLDPAQRTLERVLELLEALFGEAIRPNRSLGSFSSGISCSARPSPISWARR